VIILVEQRRMPRRRRHLHKAPMSWYERNSPARRGGKETLIHQQHVTIPPEHRAIDAATSALRLLQRASPEHVLKRGIPCYQAVELI
jgi:hypothetical protein